MEKYLRCLLDLIRSVILNDKNIELPEDINITLLFELAKKHSIENIIYVALQNIVPADNNIMTIFSEYYIHSIAHDAKQQYYLEIVTETFEKNHIPYCIMKGGVIKNLYPSSDLRQASDLDIYVGKKHTKQVKSVMESLGFVTESYDEKFHHDNYRIDKTIEIEIHREFFS